MISAGATQICMVISAEKTITNTFSERDFAAEIFYAVQQQPLGLCDALFRADPSRATTTTS